MCLSFRARGVGGQMTQVCTRQVTTLGSRQDPADAYGIYARLPTYPEVDTILGHWDVAKEVFGKISPLLALFEIFFLLFHWAETVPSTKPSRSHILLFLKSNAVFGPEGRGFCPPNSRLYTFTAYVNMCCLSWQIFEHTVLKQTRQDIFSLVKRQDCFDFFLLLFMSRSGRL